MIKKQATNLAAIRKGDNIIAKVYKGDTLRYNSAHSITYNLDGITTPSQTKVKHNAPFTLSFTTESGKVLLPSKVRVTMGEADITDTAFRILTNTIEIPSVTDNVEITAQAAAIPSGYVPLMYVHYLVAQSNTSFNTAYYPNYKTCLDVDCKLLARKTYMVLFENGSFGSAPAYWFWARYYGNGQSLFKRNSTAVGSPNNSVSWMAINKRMWVSAKQSKITYKSEEAPNANRRTITAGDDTTEWEATRFLTIGSDSYYANMLIYRFVISEDDVTLRDYIPLRRLSDNLVGLYDMVNDTFIPKNARMWIGNDIAISRTLTNCVSTRLSSGETGTAAYAVIGSTWSIKLTPSSDYTFAGGVSPQVKIANIDVTSQVVTNNGDGTYTITIVNVPQEPIEITAEAVALPYDAEVEYLESNGVGGRAYIDTGIKVASTVTFNIEAATSTTLNCFFIGGRNGYNNQQLSVTLDFTNGNVNWGFGNKTATWGTTLSATDYAFSNTASSRVLVINGHSITADSATFSINHNIYLFAMNNGGTMNAGNASAVVVIKRAKIYSSGTLVRDYIPVRKGGVGYLYDKVSGQLFENAASSGAFTYGSDVTSNGTNSLNLNNGLLGSINGDEPNDEPNEIDPIAMEDM